MQVALVAWPAGSQAVRVAAERTVLDFAPSISGGIASQVNLGSVVRSRGAVRVGADGRLRPLMTPGDEVPPLCYVNLAWTVPRDPGDGPGKKQGFRPSSKCPRVNPPGMKWGANSQLLANIEAKIRV